MFQDLMKKRDYNIVNARINEIFNIIEFYKAITEPKNCL